MRIVLQRIKKGIVYINHKLYSQINRGYIVYLGIAKDDSILDINFIINKLLKLRLFENKIRKFDKDIFQINGEILIVSQFTLFADYSKGKRPYFGKAERPKEALKVYNQFIQKLKENYFSTKIKTGKFAEKMLIKTENDGPVTLILDSKIK